jgi:hypothetical protein
VIRFLLTPLSARCNIQLSAIIGVANLFNGSRNMYHYDPSVALEELNEDALLPHPVKLRDMIMRIKLAPNEAQTMNSEFQDYITRFGELQKVARTILEKLSTGAKKSA